MSDRPEAAGTISFVRDAMPRQRTIEPLVKPWYDQASAMLDEHDMVPLSLRRQALASIAMSIEDNPDGVIPLVTPAYVEMYLDEACAQALQDEYGCPC